MIAEDAQEKAERLERAIRSTEEEHDEQKEEIEAIENEKGKPLNPYSSEPQDQAERYNRAGPETCAAIDEVLERNGAKGELISQVFVDKQYYRPLEGNDDLSWWSGPTYKTIESLQTDEIIDLMPYVSENDKYKETDKRLCKLRNITPTALKPARLEFTLQMPDDKRGEPSNKRGNRSYKTPAKSTNDGKRPTKKDDHTPIQIKGLKKKQRSKNISEQQKMTRKPKQKIPKKASKSYNKKEAKKKTKTKRGGQQKKRQSQASKYDNTATP